MFRSSLIKSLNKHLWLQYIFVILPVIMVLIYGFAYMSDVMRVSRVFAYNDKVSQTAYDSGVLYKVSHVETESDVTKAVVSTGFSDVVSVNADDVIFYVQAYNKDWYQLVTASQKSTFMPKCDLFDIEVLEDSMLKVSHGDYSHEFEGGDLVCAMTISQEGSYRVTFLTPEDPQSYDLDICPMLELLPSDGGSYKVRVNANYTVETSDFDVNFCTNLPTDDLYYNEESNSFVRNIAKDYGQTFMLRANYWIVVVSVVLYCVILYIIEGKKELSLLDSKYLMKADIFAVCVLLLCAPFTLMMFS